MRFGKIAVIALALAFAGFAFAQQQGKVEKKAASAVKVETKDKAKSKGDSCAKEDKKSMEGCASDSTMAKGGKDCCGKK
jgi:uncharacterized protein HemX